MARRLLPLLLVAAALAPDAAGDMLRMAAPGGHHSEQGRLQARRGPRKQLLDFEPMVGAAVPGGTYIPKGGQGSWESGGGTGIIMIHANLMKAGEVVGWSSRNQGLQEYGSAVYDPATRTYEQLLDECGIHDCKNSFCGAQTTTAMSEVLIFGGHAEDINWFRSYNHGTGSLWSTKMNSGRWYPGVATLGDGKVLVVGGVADSGKAGYYVEGETEYDNPSYEVYDPATKSFDGDHWEMSDQLSAAFPIHTYPHVLVAPDGGVVVSAGKLLVKYSRSGPSTFQKEFSYASRPGHPWSYPQTGEPRRRGRGGRQGVLLPILPPYYKLFFLGAIGSADDRADYSTPASKAAEIIELTAGPEATWESVGPMPYGRVMGDAVILCDGTIGFFGGSQVGVAGWSKESRDVEFRDGTSWWCEERCSKGEESEAIYEPSIFNPATASPSSSLTARHVMLAGSDVTNDQTAEIYSPPYLSKGPQPVITDAPSFVPAGSEATVAYTSASPVIRALLIRNGATTHSMNFDARALWLNIASNVVAPGGGTLNVAIPGNRNILPPGMYMLVIISDQGVPSASKIISIP
ncbi:hypothetical protein CHLNCDRAFT_145404 [Chlorella variabilis]|uniref:Uncharacterized protein n=1 Tax=Chlorella variabilis TaxID=554065 RepID=E1ZEC6_CHLVA|nr:hypothetical protein CHLNCDRAFT_145404 [Chlorella variabilis]EFN56008.1 hypothetical protein CHLNCDRAFT_145404 [Chlorella variabilis]|eukprot:XP_005848110.1 hypothetical protein CHLNCDRAFT_145404 [Chlorella variabilis]